MSWTDERIENLKNLWAEGLSASQIANQLGGVSRNAVIGKVHRLGLAGRAKPNRVPAARPKPVRDGETAPAPAFEGALALKAVPAPMPAPQRPVLREVAPSAKKATIMTLTERTCKWPIGDPSRDDFHFCGHEADVGTPYCKHHARIAYQPVNDRRREKKVVNG
jgi:GcrA cell cycle regulator